MEEILERLKEIASEIDEQAENLSSIFYDIQEKSEEIDNSAILEKIKNLTTKWDPVLDIGENISSDVDVILELLPEKEEE